MRFKILLILNVLLAGIQISNAQTSIPFRLKGGLVLIKLAIENQDATFVFDTGASTTVIDSARAAQLNLKITSSRSVPGATGTSVLNAISNVKIGPEALNVIAPSVVLINLKPLEEIIGEHFDGIIGYELLRRFVVKIDYDLQVLQFQNNLNDVERKDYTPIPFHFNNKISIPQFEISMLLQNGQTLNGQVFFDSGAAASIIVNTPFQNSHQLMEKIGKTLINKSHDLSAETSSVDAGIKSMQIGPYSLSDLPVNLSNAAAGVNAYPGYLGILGNGIIKRFNVIADYSKKILYLKPNQNFKKPFDFPMCGMKLKKPGNDIRIKYVIENSEAEQKGLQADQKILSVDGYSGEDLDEYRKRLQQEGKKIRILVQKPDGQTLEVELLLKRLI